VVSNNFSAVDGRNSGAQILVVTKSGTNQLHGGASYYFENNTLADLPPEKAVLLLGTNDVKAVLFVKADRHYVSAQVPINTGPCASFHETAFLNERKAPADPSIPTAGADVGVPNQSHILDMLYAYHAFQGLAHRESPKRDAGLDFMRQHVPRHVWFCPAIRWDDPNFSGTKHGSVTASLFSLTAA